MAERLPDCPVCAANSRTFKFSQVYIASITEPAYRSEADRRILAQVIRETDDPDRRQSMLSLFAPPQVKNTPIRSIHPDLTVFLLGVSAFAFISLTFLERTKWAWGAYAALGGLLCLYLMLRRKLFVWLKIPTRSSKADSSTKSEMIRRWGLLYYCARDNCIFDPARGDWVRLEDVYHYLAAGESSLKE